MTAKHTPAPWTAAQDLHCGLHGHPADWGIYASRRLARIEPALNRDPTEEDSANARLIAAAPELLSALRHSLDVIYNETHGDRSPWVTSAIQTIDNAIAKATGQRANP